MAGTNSPFARLFVWGFCFFVAVLLLPDPLDSGNSNPPSHETTRSPSPESGIELDEASGEMPSGDDDVDLEDDSWSSALYSAPPPPVNEDGYDTEIRDNEETIESIESSHDSADDPTCWSDWSEQGADDSDVCPKEFINEDVKDISIDPLPKSPPPIISTENRMKDELRQRIDEFKRQVKCHRKYERPFIAEPALPKDISIVPILDALCEEKYEAMGSYLTFHRDCRLFYLNLLVRPSWQKDSEELRAAYTYGLIYYGEISPSRM
jgi:hypothetical protein